MASRTEGEPLPSARELDLRDLRDVVEGARSTWNTWLLLASGSIVAVALRLELFGTSNSDLRNATIWLHNIRADGFHALGGGFADYTPPYLYYLWITNAVLHPHVRDEAILKIGPILADFVLAFVVYKLVRLRFPQGLAPTYAYLAILFAPTICLNSAYWGQVDAVWTIGVAACLYFVMTRRELLGFVALGLAFAFKVQTVFVLPFLAALALRRKIAWQSFLVLPGVYLVMIVPAAIAGRPFGDLLKIYVSQANYYRDLTLNAANVYQWVPATAHQLNRSALIWALVLVCILTVALAARAAELTAAQMVACATASVLVVPFVLPHMHERYFYAGDVLSIVLAFYMPQGFVVALAVQVTSLFQYGPFLFGSAPIPLRFVAIGLLATILILLRAIARSLAQPKGELRLFPARAPEAAAGDVGP